MSELHAVRFDNGLRLHFRDRSNRYFGDYHRVSIEIEACFEHDGATRRLQYQRPLQRMAVAGEDVEACRSELIAQFLRTAAGYMQQRNFPSRLLESLGRPGQKLWRCLD